MFITICPLLYGKQSTAYSFVYIDNCPQTHLFNLFEDGLIRLMTARKVITSKSKASNPLNTNSNKVFKFSGSGDVTNILEYLYNKINYNYIL